MIFLNPAILLGLLAASIPIIIHLLNFRKLKKVEFSTLAFLKELQKSKIKKLKIKQWLLLLVRILIIIFLVLAFARPTLESVNFIGSTASAKSSSVFILDNSFSMSYFTDQGSNFNRSKKVIKDLINKLEDGDEIFLVSISDSIKKTANKENALKILDEIEITQLTKPVSSIIEFAIETLNNSQNINKEIYLFSDFQKSTFLNEKYDSIKIANNNIKLYSFDMSTDKPNNFSVSDLRLVNTIIELNQPIQFSATVSNFSPSTINNFSASLFINDERVAQQNISLLSNETKTLQFETILKTVGLIEAKVVLEDDNILQDNICYLNFNIPEKINVLLLYDSIEDIAFIDAALNSYSNSKIISVIKKPMNKISFIDLADFDVIFLVSSEDTETTNIANYLRNGGRLILFPTSNTNIIKYNLLLKALNIPLIERKIQTDKTDLNFAEFNKIDLSHPIFENVFSNTKKQQIESPNIYNYIRYQDQQNVETIIQLNDKSLFLGEKNLDKGKILFFNVSPDLNSSNFPLKGIFAPLITKSVFYLSSNQSEIKNYLVGETITVKFANQTSPILDVDFPGGSEKINLQNLSANILEFKNNKLAGSYKFYNNKNLVDFASVNINSKESNLVKIEMNKLEVYFTNLLNDNFLLLNPEENYSQKISQARYGTELWKLFLLFAFLLALIEMFIARSTKKDLIDLDQK